MLQNNDSFMQVSGEVISAIYEMSKGSNMLMAENTVRPRKIKCFCQVTICIICIMSLFKYINESNVKIFGRVC